MSGASQAGISEAKLLLNKEIRGISTWPFLGRLIRRRDRERGFGIGIGNRDRVSARCRAELSALAGKPRALRAVFS